MAMANPGTGCVWVTGASSGIGSEVAASLAGDGHKVAISARSRESLRNLASEQENTNLHDFELDVTDGIAVAQTAAAIEAELGHIHTAVLCAGTYKPISAGAFDAMEACRQVDVNVGGVLNCLDPLLRAMLTRGTGHIAIVSSLTSRFGSPMPVSMELPRRAWSIWPKPYASNVKEKALQSRSSIPASWKPR